MADGSLHVNPQLLQQVLFLLQEWAYALRPRQFGNAFNRLKSRGVVFPPRSGNPNSVPSLGVGGQFQPYTGLSPGPPQPGHVYAPAAAAGGGGIAMGTAWPGEPPARVNAGMPGRLSPNQPPQKLREDLEVARNTIALLGELLDGVEDGGTNGGTTRTTTSPSAAEVKSAINVDYIDDMVGQCSAMKNKLMAVLIPNTSDEAIMADALVVNEDAQSVLERHRRLVEYGEGRSTTLPVSSSRRGGGGGWGRRPPPPPPTTAPAAIVEGGGENATGTAEGGSEQQLQQKPGHKKNKSSLPLIELLDVNWGPSMSMNENDDGTVSSGGGGVVDPFAAGGEEQEQGGSGGGKKVAPPTLAPAMSNNPFAAPSPQKQPAFVSPSNTTTPAAAAAVSNPFMNDSVFAPISSPTTKPASASPSPKSSPAAAVAETTMASAYATAPAPSPIQPSMMTTTASAGNPFALATPPPPPPRTNGAPHPPPPPPVYILNNNNMASPSRTPAGGGISPVISSGGFTPIPSFSASSPTPSRPGAVVASPSLTDAFGDLVKIGSAAKQKTEEKPLPPRGTPMRGSTSYMGGGDNSPSGVGVPSGVVAASSSSEGQRQQGATGTSANGGGDALSAFDAFEELASVRSTSTSNTPAWR